jgi:integrase
MSENITVHVMKYGDRPAFIMYYTDPITGKRKTRSTKTTIKREAEKKAAKWEAELREGRYQPLSNMTWEQFRQRYELEVVPTMAERTGRQIATVFNSIEQALSPARLRDLTENRLSHYQANLRARQLSEESIRSYLAHLKSALAWAVEMKLILVVPSVRLPKRARGAKRMKGRPITGEEFDRMLSKIVDGIVLAAEETRQARAKLLEKAGRKPAKQRSEAARQRDRQMTHDRARMVAPRWERLLRGLKLSGLRLGEALNLSWDDETKIMVDLSGRRPMLRILAELEKGGQDRVHPITPDFEEFLLATPTEQRTGPVFPMGDNGESVGLEFASKTIACIGKAAHVLVDRKSGKNASAHDLRRAFGEKWSKLVMPAVLQQLMRHEDISTTMAYYVGQNAESTADAVWEAFAKSNDSGNNSQEGRKSDASGSSQVQPR